MKISIKAFKLPIIFLIVAIGAFSALYPSYRNLNNRFEVVSNTEKFHQSTKVDSSKKDEIALYFSGFGVFLNYASAVGSIMAAVFTGYLIILQMQQNMEEKRKYEEEKRLRKISEKENKEKEDTREILALHAEALNFCEKTIYTFDGASYASEEAFKIALKEYNSLIEFYSKNDGEGTSFIDNFTQVHECLNRYHKIYAIIIDRIGAYSTKSLDILSWRIRYFSSENLILLCRKIIELYTEVPPIGLKKSDAQKLYRELYELCRYICDINDIISAEIEIRKRVSSQINS